MTLHPDEIQGLEKSVSCSFADCLEEGFYYNICQRNFNEVWYLRPSPDKSKISAESSHGSSFEYPLSSGALVVGDLCGFSKIDPKEILSFPDSFLFDKPKDFVRKKLAELAQNSQENRD